MHIRKAHPEDAEGACEALRRSITELCQPDHGGDRACIARWLANKTPASVRAWITDPASYVFVAVVEKTIVGVGAVTTTGHITLNYVSPECRFRGVSKALLTRLEAQAQELGLGSCTLESTETARSFYRAAGYSETARPHADKEIVGRFMSKRFDQQ